MLILMLMIRLMLIFLRHFAIDATYLLLLMLSLILMADVISRHATPCRDAAAAITLR